MNYKSVKRKKLVRYIDSMGFESRGGSKHEKFCIEIGDKTYTLTIPRSKTLSPGLVDQVSKTLVNNCGFDKNDVINNLK